MALSMKILYDGSIYWQTAGGISRYFTNLIDHLPDNFLPALTTCTSNSIHTPNHPRLKKYYYKRFGFRPGRISYWAEKHYFRSIETFQRFDLAHPTYYSLLTRRDIHHYRFPIVITVHDMIHEIFAEQIDPTGENAEMKRKAISSAQAILCVSENTKRDLLDHLPVPEERITVTPLASEIKAEMAYGPEPVPSHPYYLFVGARSNYKNFGCLLEAFSKIAFTRPELMLCIVGAPFDSDEKKQIAELNLEEQIHNYGYISDAHLAKLYRCSTAFVYPSHYEGFGIPLLEAMTCGAVVIASNTSSVPEVVGDAGLLFNSRSVHELVDRLLFVLDNSSECDRLIERGSQRAKMFSWNKTALQTVNAYQSIVE